jgi:hypothetical protein
MMTSAGSSGDGDRFLRKKSKLKNVKTIEEKGFPVY